MRPTLNCSSLCTSRARTESSGASRCYSSVLEQRWGRSVCNSLWISQEAALSCCPIEAPQALLLYPPPGPHSSPTFFPESPLLSSVTACLRPVSWFWFLPRTPGVSVRSVCLPLSTGHRPQGLCCPQDLPDQWVHHLHQGWGVYFTSHGRWRKPVSVTT